MSQDPQPTPFHQSVMAEEVAEVLQPIERGVVVDATFGGGGHTALLLDRHPNVTVIGLDRDPAAIANAASLGPRLNVMQSDFRYLGEALDRAGVDQIDGALFDLGVSSRQLDDPERGFSYRHRGPLDMRMGPDAAISADDVVNGWDAPRLAGAIRRYGEEPHASRIAAAILAARPVTDTGQLAEIVAGAVPAGARSRRHPARRTFQAIRIVVNEELAALEEGLETALQRLRVGGRAIVISYHSLEDRLVKRRFAAGARGCTCPPDFPVCVCGGTAELRLLTRRPLRPTLSEVEANPRSRSARMRAVERVEEAA
jgi:16S rRNA (cytosine1402-N4)-methyltransferase